MRDFVVAARERERERGTERGRESEKEREGARKREAARTKRGVVGSTLSACPKVEMLFEM